MQMLTWLESSALEAGSLSNLLKSLVAQYSHKHHITDGKQTLLFFIKRDVSVDSGTLCSIKKLYRCQCEQVSCTWQRHLHTDATPRWL